jgi:hypothetical protein
MIKTQIVKEGKKPIAVLMDYREYKRLKELEEDKADRHVLRKHPAQSAGVEQHVSKYNN